MIVVDNKDKKPNMRILITTIMDLKKSQHQTSEKFSEPFERKEEDLTSR